MRIKPLLLTAVLLLVGLVACQQPNTPATDLAPVLTRLDAQGANLDAVRGELVNLREKVEELRRAAVLLDVAVRDIGKLDITSINWGALTGVIIHTAPSTLDVNAEPGECPPDLDRGLGLVPRNAVVGTSFHAMPAGTYCLSIGADETYQAAAQTVVLPDGVIAEVLLIPQYQPADEEGE